MKKLTSVALVMVLAACADPGNVSPDPAIQHPIRVEMREVRLVMQAPFSAETLSVGEISRIRSFIADYMDRGRGPVNLTASGGAGANPAWLDQAHRILLEAGLRPGEMVASSGNGNDGEEGVIASFNAHVAIPPECDDFSSGSSWNPDNFPHRNFGCSTQRNIGLMVQDPGDLVTARDASPRDPVRSVLNITDYRIGGITASSKPQEQRSGFASEDAGRDFAGDKDK